MAYRTLMVRSEPDVHADQAIGLAVRVAAMFDAAIVGVGAEALDPTVYSAVDGPLMAALQNQIDTDIAEAKVRFESLTKAVAAGASWISTRGYPLDVMARHASGADLIIARRPSHHAGSAYSCTPSDLLSVTGLPLLLAPDRTVEFKADRVVVGWRNRREANRAITDALPFLMRAEEVRVVNVCHADEADPDGLAEVAKRLARHGVAVSTTAVAPTAKGVAADIEAAADAFGADLIVCGAYHHSRLREWVLGGVTQDFMVSSAKFLLLSR